jgi:hypothetical protein
VLAFGWIATAALASTDSREPSNALEVKVGVGLGYVGILSGLKVEGPAGRRLTPPPTRRVPEIASDLLSGEPPSELNDREETESYLRVSILLAR